MSRDTSHEAKNVIASQIGIVLCRVGAAILVVQAIRSLGYSLPGMIYAYEDIDAEFWAFALLSFVPGLVAIGLWVFAERICSLPNRDGSAQAPVSMLGADIARIGTSLIGVYLLAYGISTGINVEVQNWALSDLASGNDRSFGEHSARIVGSRAGYIAQILLGVALVAGRDRISNFLTKAKYAGIDIS